MLLHAGLKSEQGSEPPNLLTLTTGWKLRESVAYGDGVGVSTEAAAHDASGAIVNDASRIYDYSTLRPQALYGLSK